MEEKQYGLLEAIEILNREPQAQFKRFNDEKFIIFRSEEGNLMARVGDIIITMPIFNYINIDFWIKL